MNDIDRTVREYAQAASLGPDGFLRTLLDWYGKQPHEMQQVALGRMHPMENVFHESIQPTLDKLVALFNGPEHAEPHELSAALLAGITDAARRVNLSNEAFLRQIVAKFFDKILYIEKCLQDGSIRKSEGGVTMQDVLYPPLPLASAVTFEVHGRDQFPEFFQNPVWVDRVDWSLARCAIDAGKAICFHFDPAEFEAVRTVVTQRLGEVVTRLDIETFRLWVVRSYRVSHPTPPTGKSVFSQS